MAIFDQGDVVAGGVSASNSGDGSPPRPSDCVLEVLVAQGRATNVQNEVDGRGGRSRNDADDAGQHLSSACFRDGRRRARRSRPETNGVVSLDQIAGIN